MEEHKFEIDLCPLKQGRAIVELENKGDETK
jgi:hypothetical protein